ncbi:hypothetical protein BC936DRAFT_137838 [Jimgerdemannia flammicorona]|uniref:Uncharacterized protein n=2 Tax=Jimgerdemannia flammicorona TaxID=994334 RepID=A0A433CWJ5_9FUNG|nr:hypothetical protein BC936DRAFT_137838 [Jimgerdemannia flammicorona]RUS25839.1 hypothetical protein BC938DRAFT_471582 [Jimgerdemannia flammicorona]
MAWGSNANAVNEWVRRLTTNDPTFISLHILSFRRVTPAEFATLFSAIGQNRTLRELYCSGHRLDVAAMQSLVDALKVNMTVTSVNVGGSTFGTDEKGGLFETLCEGLAKNTGVAKIDLENKGLTVQSARVLAKCIEKHRFLTEINLCRNSLDDEAVEVVCWGIAAGATVNALSPLRRLDLSMNSIRKKGAEAIAEILANPNVMLTDLDLSDNPLTVAGATAIGTALAYNKSITSLKISGITGAELGNLDLDASKALNPSNKPTAGDLVLVAIAGSLRTNTTLQSLHMIANDIGPLGIQTLASSLASNTALTDLRLRQNRIGNDGALTLGKALSGSGNRTLRRLDLAENSISSVGFAHLIQCEGVEYLGLFNNRINTYGETLTFLPSADHHELRTLDLGCNAVTTTDFAVLCRALTEGFAPALQSLDIGGNVRNEEEEHQKWEDLEEELMEKRQGLDVAWKRVGMEGH